MNDQDVDLQARFPSMRPLRSAPTLFTINGCGLKIYGRRDFDRATGTYVKTRFIVLLFLPLFALGSYRVADGRGGGWYFVGKEPLSRLARTWNQLLLLALLGGSGVLGWQSYTTSPDYLAGQQLAAAAAQESTRPTEAVAIWAAVARGKTRHAATARAALATQLAKLSSLAPEQAVDVHAALVGSRSLLETESLTAATTTLIDRLRPQAPEQAYQVLQQAGDLVPDAGTLRRALLEELVVARPQVRWASDLAMLLDGGGDSQRCESLLTPYAAELGSTEAARILGQIWARAGRRDEAYSLLTTYCSERLQRYQQAESAWLKAQEAAADRSLKSLQKGAAGDTWYTTYDAAGEDAQQAMIRTWVNEQLLEDPQVNAAEGTLRTAAAVVPVALDLGVVAVLRAQNLQNPAERRRELEAAERIFLAIQGAAGESDAYRLFYGKVCWWLGKTAEGKATFDALLAAADRSHERLLEVANVLRDVGAVDECRALAEEAYGKAATDAERWHAAMLQAANPRDEADRELWLGRCDPANAWTLASLAEVRGDRAWRESRDQEAIRLYQEALAIWCAMPRSSTSLHNASVSAHSLHAADGAAASYQRFKELNAEALALDPEQPIVLTFRVLLRGQAVVRSALDGRLDLAVLRNDGDAHLLALFRSDQATASELRKLLRAAPECPELLADMERLQVLAPRSPDYGGLLLGWQSLLGDLEGMRRTRDRLAAGELDHGDAELDRTRRKEPQRRTKDVAALRSALTRQEHVVARLGDQPASRAAACLELCSVRGRLQNLGEAVDIDATIAMLDSSLRDWPCEATSSVLANWLCRRALWRLALARPGMAASLEACDEELSSMDLACLVLGAEGTPASQTLRKDPDLIRASAILASMLTSLPEALGMADLYVVHSTNSKLKAACRDLLVTDGRMDVLGDSAVLLQPQNCSAALASAWQGEMSAAADSAVIATAYAKAERICPDIAKVRGGR